MNDRNIPSNEQVSWRCFHCTEVFTDREAAADHFGVQIDGCADDVACKLNAKDGLLLKMLREAQRELRQYHQEDTAAFRQFYALGADHTTALRREEEKGYARGLEDAKKHPETLGLRSADETTTPRSTAGLTSFPRAADRPLNVAPVLGSGREVSDEQLASMIKFENEHSTHCALVELWERRGAVKTSSPPCLCDWTEDGGAIARVDPACRSHGTAARRPGCMFCGELFELAKARDCHEIVCRANPENKP